MAVEEAYELAKVGRGDVVVDGAEISMIGNVQRISAEAEVMLFAVLPFPIRDAESAVTLEVQ